MQRATFLVFASPFLYSTVSPFILLYVEIR